MGNGLKAYHHEIREITSLKDMLDGSARLYSERPAFLVKKEKGGKYHQITYAQFKNDVDVPAALELLQGRGFELDPMMTSYFLSRATVVPTLGSGMAPWREKLFASMHRNAAAAADKLARESAVEAIGTAMDITRLESVVAGFALATSKLGAPSTFTWAQAASSSSATMVARPV